MRGAARDGLADVRSRSGRAALFTARADHARQPRRCSPGSSPTRPSVRFRAELPEDRERLNVLLIGIDSAPGRTEALTNSLIVVARSGRPDGLDGLDPARSREHPARRRQHLRPEDQLADELRRRHPKQFPAGGIGTLEKAVGVLFGIPIHAYASIDLAGFARWSTPSAESTST